jgi:hypothetical protein
VAYVTASDDDYGPTYNQISYSIKQELDYEYFDINANALLTTLKSLKQFENSTKLYTVVQARDKGNRESSVTVTVVVQQGTSEDFFDDPNTVAWFAALMAMLVILLAFVIVCLYRFCKNGYVFSKKGLCQKYVIIIFCTFLLRKSYLFEIIETSSRSDCSEFVVTLTFSCRSKKIHFDGSEEYQPDFKRK